ncbi:hypothetical protein B0H66DRAFT_608597 [Apodospora peruviana]|uniref:2EXR domain-containing protein n=1 Tax=Apodospora peruviana TaxID=516989 RepID=A0AAE0HT16_9PEZI|nr:hypothetical protein B0H66DRAFT_608597 [Apodospora peruviana]
MTEAGNNKIFTCFGALPPELREMIWREALSAPCVLVITTAEDAEARQPNIRGNTTRFSKPYISRLFAFRFLGGPPPYQAGLSCREAYAIMERKLVRLARNFRHRDGRGPPFWVNPDATLVYFGPPWTAHVVLERLRQGLQQSLLSEHILCRHAAFGWESGFRFTIGISVWRLLEAWPSLCSLAIIQRETELTADDDSDDDDDAATATNAAAAAAMQEQQQDLSSPVALPQELFASLMRYAASQLRASMEADMDFVEHTLGKCQRLKLTTTEENPCLYLASSTPPAKL